jgi:hypothetical protein
MTKVGQIIQEEIDVAVSAAASAAVNRRDREIAQDMLRDGKDPAEILRYTKLSREDLDALLLAKV